MPIKFNYLFSKKECTLIQFGTGDINMHPGISPLNSLYFFQDTPKPVSEWNQGVPFKYDDPKPVDEAAGELVMMTFTKTESIDTIIECLLEVKKNMLADVDKMYLLKPLMP